MLAAAVVAGCLALVGAGLYLRFKMPWPFYYEGQKYRRMPDGTFQNATKAPVLDSELIPKLTLAYEAAKYGRRDISDLDHDA